jgi:hypothetical protein
MFASVLRHVHPKAANCVDMLMSLVLQMAFIITLLNTQSRCMFLPLSLLLLYSLLLLLLGCECRHVMHAHLTHLSEPSTTLQGLTEQAAFFLLSICIRSAEGRRRIVSEIVQTLNPSDRSEQRPGDQSVVCRAASNPYRAQPGFPAPHKVLTCTLQCMFSAFALLGQNVAKELVGTLLWRLRSSKTCRHWCEAPIQRCQTVRSQHWAKNPGCLVLFARLFLVIVQYSDRLMGVLECRQVSACR